MNKMEKEELEERFQEIDVHFTKLLEKRMKQFREDIIEAVSEVMSKALADEAVRIHNEEEKEEEEEVRVVELDSQVLTGMQKCLYYWNLRFNEHWTPNSKSEPLEKGDLGHQFLKYYFSELQTNQMTGRVKSEIEIIREAREIARQASIDLESTPGPEIERIIDITERSCHRWLETDRDMEIIFVERPFSKVLYESEAENLTIVYTGIIDLAISSKMTKNTPMDHKTQGKDYPIFSLQNQFPGYAWALNTNWVIVNKIGYQKVKSEEERFKRITLSYPDAVIENWRLQAIQTVKDAIIAFENGIGPQHKRFGSCSQYWGCEFIKVCENGAMNKEIETNKLMTDFYKGVAWSPYTRDGRAKNEMKNGEAST